MDKPETVRIDKTIRLFVSSTFADNDIAQAKFFDFTGTTLRVVTIT